MTFFPVFGSWAKKSTLGSGLAGMLVFAGCGGGSDEFEWADSVTVPIDSIDSFINGLGEHPVRGRDLLTLIDACYWLRTPESKQPDSSRLTIEDLARHVERYRGPDSPETSVEQRVLHGDPWTAGSREIRSALAGALSVTYLDKRVRLGSFDRDSIAIRLQVENTGTDTITAFAGHLYLTHLTRSLATVEVLEFVPVPPGAVVRREITLGLNPAMPSDIRLRDAPAEQVGHEWEAHTVLREVDTLIAIDVRSDRRTVSCRP